MGAMPPQEPTAEKSARHDGWGTLRRFLPYLWPHESPGLRWRIVLACLLIVASKAVTLTLPYLLKWAIDLMSISGPAVFTLALAWVIAYAAGRLAATDSHISGRRHNGSAGGSTPSRSRIRAVSATKRTGASISPLR